MDTLARALNPLLMIALPLALGVTLARRYRVDWRYFGLGALAFFGSQVLHIPFNVWVLSPGLTRLGFGPTAQGASAVVFALVIGLSAGIFEESARYLLIRLWPRLEQRWENAMMFGAGHGGLEAILLGLLVGYGFFQALALRGVPLETAVPAEQLALTRSQLAAYWALPWHLAILGAVERLGTLGVHLGLTILVLQAFTRRHLGWLGLAIGWHTLVNAGALLLLPAIGPYGTEGFVLACGALSLGIAFRLRPPSQPTADAPASGTPLLRPIPGEPTADQLEDSRYA
jgi:uncharacterized membrane protein YhfC